MQAVFYFDNSSSASTHSALGIAQSTQERITKAFNSSPLQIPSITGGSFPSLSMALYHFMDSQVPDELGVGIFVTSSYTDNVTTRSAIEARLQRDLSPLSFVLIAPFPGLEPEIERWMRWLSEQHPCRQQIDILWDENPTEALQRKLLPWIQRKLNPPRGSSAR